MKKLTLKDTTKEDMMKMLAEKREELRTIRFSAMGSRTTNSSSSAKIRADVARIMTELGARNRAPKDVIA